MAISMRITATLCFIIEEDNILLIYKKKGFEAGKYNGIGGRVERGESIEEAAKREVKEEVGVDIDNLEYTGLLEFYSIESEPDWRVYVFKAKIVNGTPIETDEAKPLWFKVNELPYESMWEDDRVWLPLLLKG